MKDVAFRYVEVEPLEGLVVFRDLEHSFDFVNLAPSDLEDRVGNSGLTSLSIGTMQIEVSLATHCLLFVWGLHPRTQWISGIVDPPNFKSGGVQLTCPSHLDSGVSVKVLGMTGWLTTYDEKSGWVRTHLGIPKADTETIGIASDTVIGLAGDQLNSVWLNPAFE
jgi:hypothetical protein